jgi:hypothetical protein
MATIADGKTFNTRRYPSTIIAMVIFEAIDVAGRVLRVRREHVGRQTAFLLEIETAGHGH